MAYSYKSPDRDQQFLLPPSIRDWLPEDHLVWFVIDIVSVMDLSAFHARHPNDGVGRRAYDPEMMLAVLLYAYCTGLRSSRRIAAACRSDIAFKALCADVVPDHDALGRFRAEHSQALTDCFVDVLRLCTKAGLASLGTIAIDGTKVGSDAALAKNRSEGAIRAEVERVLAEGTAADAAEAAQPTLDGEFPEELARPGSRLARLRAALGEIEAEKAQRRQAERQRRERLAADAAQGRRPRGAAPKGPGEALDRAEADVAALAARRSAAKGQLSKLEAASELEKGQQRLVAAREAAEGAPEPPEPQANTTDPRAGS